MQQATPLLGGKWVARESSCYWSSVTPLSLKSCHVQLSRVGLAVLGGNLSGQCMHCKRPMMAMTLAWAIRAEDRGSLCSISFLTLKLYHLSPLQVHFPTVEKAIIDRLNALHNRSVPLTLVTIRVVIVAMLMNMVPEIFNIKAPDRSFFWCSDSFLRAWLHKTMGWSEWKATHAAQKLP